MNQIPFVPAYYTPEQAGILSSLCVQILDQQQPEQREYRGRANYQIVLVAEHDDLETRFSELLKEWKSGSRSSSFSSSTAMHPAYQRIIGLGKDVLPLILRELEKAPDHWFWALKSISGEDPVPPQCRGNMRAMSAAWINWGREKGYVR